MAGQGYSTDIDQETQEFIDISGGFFPDTGGDRTIEDQRRHYAELCRHFHGGRPEGVVSEDHMIEGVNTRLYSKSPTPKAQILYIHGGGFVVGNLDSHDDVCAEICAATNCDVMAVDYRLAPEHKHPAALDDCRIVLKHLLGQNRPTLIAGDSAGAWLSAMLSHEMGADLLGQVLIYPMLGGAMDQGSYIDQADAPMLTTNQVAYYWQIYFDCPVRKDALTPPMAYEDIGQTPKTVMLGASCDPLFSDTLDYAEKLTASKTVVEVTIAEGLPHGFLRARHSVEKAKTAFAQLMAGINTLIT